MIYLCATAGRILEGAELERRVEALEEGIGL